MNTTTKEHIATVGKGQGLKQVKSFDDPKLAEKLNQAYQGVLQGLRTSILAGKSYGEALLAAQKELGCNDGELYAWVRKNTDCKLGDTSLSGYRRLAENWPGLVGNLGEESLHKKTLVEVLALCRKHKRISKRAASAPPTPSATSQPNAASVGNHHDGAQAATSIVDGKEEPPVNVRQPFDLPDGALLYEYRPTSTCPLQVMAKIVIPSLTSVVEADITKKQVPLLAAAIKEAMVLLHSLRVKHAIS